jgi:hypothetical protein
MKVKGSWYTPRQPLLGEVNTGKSQCGGWKKLCVAAVLSCLCFHLYSPGWAPFASTDRHYNSATCPQTTALLPIKNAPVAKDLASLYDTEAFRSKAISWLSGAVQIPSVFLKVQ